MVGTSIHGVSQINWTNNPVGEIFARQGGEMPEGVFRFTSDGIEVFTLNSSSATEFYQPASLFYGDNEQDKAKIDSLAPSGKVASSMNCFLINLDGKKYLIDTGLPASRGGMTMERLNSIGVSPEEIDVIFLTHSHFDHIGGLISEDGKANYPSAQVYISEAEYAYMENSMAKIFSDLNKAYGRRFQSFSSGEILPEGVLAISLPGHTPGHVGYRIGNLLFAGDFLHGMAIQITDPTICANFDMDKPLAIKSRIDVMNFAVMNSLTLLGAHVPNNGVVF